MKQILVVDGDPNTLKVIKIRLETEGYKVFAATTSDQATAFLEEELPLPSIKMQQRR